LKGSPSVSFLLGNAILDLLSLLLESGIPFLLPEAGCELFSLSERVIDTRLHEGLALLMLK
jgi:hypothetical protein